MEGVEGEDDPGMGSPCAARGRPSTRMSVFDRKLRTACVARGGRAHDAGGPWCPPNAPRTVNDGGRARGHLPAGHGVSGGRDQREPERRLSHSSPLRRRFLGTAEPQVETGSARLEVATEPSELSPVIRLGRPATPTAPQWTPLRPPPRGSRGPSGDLHRRRSHGSWPRTAPRRAAGPGGRARRARRR